MYLLIMSSVFLFWIAERPAEKKNLKIQKQEQWILLHSLQYIDELYKLVHILSLYLFLFSIIVSFYGYSLPCGE